MLGALPVHAEPASLTSLGPLIGLAALGAFHGINPAMGWLFAVSLGLQRESVKAVVTAALYIAVGHIASLAVVAVALAISGYFIPLFWVRIVSGVFLVAFGLYKLVLYFRHFRWVGMNVGGRDLVVWSFLMATSHGAGLMLAPIILNLDEEGAGATGDLDHHAGLLDLSDTAAAWGIGLATHSVAMLAVMLIIAVLVYEKLGLAFLRRGWLNVDLLWAAALILAGLVTLGLALS